MAKQLLQPVYLRFNLSRNYIQLIKKPTTLVVGFLKYRVGLESRKEVFTFIIDNNESREILNFDFEYGFHT
jgi:hypothetical protein